MHYALVADLMPREEFDERVWKKCEELGGVVDETTAAMLVVDELGRSHIKICDIARSVTEIVCFFGKVLEKSGPRIFERKDMEGEQGVVASLVVGDPTGTIKLTLWDALAASVEDIAVGSVLEIVAKPRPGGREATCTALRESIVEIVETKRPPKQDLLNRPLEVKILAVFPEREITRRDGSTSNLQVFIAGDESGTVRITCWLPELFDGINEGDSIAISGVRRREEDGNVEYVVLDSADVELLERDIEVLTIDAGEVDEGHTPVVKGTIETVSDIRRFTTRRGTESCVRNIKIRGENGKHIFAALWGEAAEDFYLAGDEVTVINADAKTNRYGEIELSVGYSAVIRAGDTEPEYVKIRGMVIPRPEGLTLDDGKEVWILSGVDDIAPGSVIEAEGLSVRGRVAVSGVSVVEADVRAASACLAGKPDGI